MKRAVLIVVGLLVAVVVVGCSVLPHSSAAPEFARVRVGRLTGCWPIANTALARQKGLRGVVSLRHPLVYTYAPAQADSYDTFGVGVPVRGVWVGRGWRVVGTWRDGAESHTQHHSPGAVWALIELPRGWRAPRHGDRVHVGAKCRGDGQL